MSEQTKKPEAIPEELTKEQLDQLKETDLDGVVGGAGSKFLMTMTLTSQGNLSSSH